MQIKYFQSAWGDIKNSPGWFGKLCLLALIYLIPIVGWVLGPIATYGYLFGWAREISWGTHAPMPKRIFGNEDGKFWRRGWFVLLVVLVFALVPGIVTSIGSGMQSAALVTAVEAPRGASGGSAVLGLFGGLIYFIGVLGSLFVNLLSWIGGMRATIYDRLSAGFQLSKIWKMFRHDTGGIMRIFGMYLLVGLIVSIIISIIASIVIAIVFAVGAASMAASGVSLSALEHMTQAQLMRVLPQILAAVGIVGILGLLLVCYVAFVMSMLLCALVYRAMGYWTAQFDVPHWKGQDDPMPFELQQAPAAQPYGQGMPPQGAAPQGAPYQGAAPQGATPQAPYQGAAPQGAAPQAPNQGTAPQGEAPQAPNQGTAPQGEAYFGGQPAQPGQQPYGAGASVPMPVPAPIPSATPAPDQAPDFGQAPEPSPLADSADDEVVYDEPVVVDASFFLSEDQLAAAKAEADDALGVTGLEADDAAGVTGLGADDAVGVTGLGADDVVGVTGLGADGTVGVTGLGADGAAGVTGLGADGAAGVTGLETDDAVGATGLETDEPPHEEK